MSLVGQVRREVGRFVLDVSVTAAAGETVAVLGPNGSGKSTLFRCLSGLAPIDAGRIELDGVTLDEPGRSVFVPAEHRPVAVVFQDYLLFPHLTARDNVAFGRRARGEPARVARVRADEWLARVGLAEHANHRPAALSGGQAQRVALARALATEPRLLLLDEPLAALDAGTRATIRRDLRRHLARFDGVRLLVTHDPVDAYALADRVVILEAGRVVQTGRLPEVTARPRSRYVADLVGLNLVAGRGEGASVVTSTGTRIVTGDDVEGDTFAAIAPHSIALYRTVPDGSPRNAWAGTVAELDRQGERVRVRIEGVLPLVAEITAGALAELALRPGDPVWATVKATEVTTYPA